MNFDFPKQPNSRIYGKSLTPEQEVIMKLVQGQRIDSKEEEILKESIEFYKLAYAYLEQIDLAKLEDDDLEKLLPFLKSVFNININIQNKINFNFVFRATNVSDKFLENGKVRDVKYISFPPEEIIKNKGVYGRANTPNSTLFYCAFEPGVAILETKPKVGDRIIIAQWINEGAKDIITYPITNNKTIDNDSLKFATKAFQERMSFNHPLLAEILDRHLSFLSSEFVKDVVIQNPKKFEYLFSAYFSEKILDNHFDPIDHPTEPIKHYDAIIYPSIAIKHKSENLAITPDSVPKLKPYEIEDCIVVKTMYDNPDLSDDKLPIVRKVLRRATEFNGNNIIWNDD